MRREQMALQMAQGRQQAERKRREEEEREKTKAAAEEVKQEEGAEDQVNAALDLYVTPGQASPPGHQV